ncbi:MAG: CHAT domain-containing protein [Cyanobacteria bacterium P01_E01_bin.6]
MNVRLSFWYRVFRSAMPSAIAPLLLGGSVCVPIAGMLTTQPVAAQSAPQLVDEADRLVEQAGQLRINQQGQAALDLLRQALDLYEQAGEDDRVQAMAVELAQGYLASGQAQRALPFVFRAMEMIHGTGGAWQTPDDRYLEMGLLQALETIAIQTQQIDAIVTYLNDQVTQFQTAGDRPRELLYLGRIASLYKLQGNAEQAEALYLRLLSLAETHSNLFQEIEALQGLIELYQYRLSPDGYQQWSELLAQRSFDFAPNLTDEELAALTADERQAEYETAQLQGMLEMSRQSWADLQAVLAEAEAEPDAQRTPIAFDGDWSDFLANEYSAQVIQYSEQTLAEAIANQDWPAALGSLSQLIPVYHGQENYEQVIEHSQTLLTLVAAPDTYADLDIIPPAFYAENIEFFALYFLADAQYALGHEQEAIDTAVQARDRYQASSYGESIFPPRLPLFAQTIPGNTAWGIRNRDGAIAQAQRAAELATLSDDPRRYALAIGALGYAYIVNEEFSTAQTTLEEALRWSVDLGDTDYQAYSLSSLIRLYLTTGDYIDAFRTGEQLLALAAQGTSLVSDDQLGYAQSFYCVVCVGQVYESLGQYQQAQAFYEQVLADAQTDVFNYARVEALTSLGNVHLALEEEDEAIAYFQQSIDNTFGIPSIDGLIGLSRAYLHVGKPDQALEVASEAVRLARQQGYQTTIGLTLPWLGDVQVALGNDAAASNAYQEALAIAQTLDLPESEVHLLGRLAQLWVAQDQPELAIVFYKQAVNRQEQLRQQVRTLSPDLQQSYTEAIAPTYRALADLLLQQNRILEAQQVLELLKLQEVDDYLRTVRGSGVESTVIDSLPPEAELFRIYNDKLADVVALGKELEEILQIEPGDRTPAQEERRQTIEASQRDLIQDFVEFTRSPQVEALVDQLRQAEGGETLEPRLLRTLQDNLQQLDNTAVLLYPLVLEDRLELLFVTPYAPPIRRPVPVSRVELNRVITDFRTALEDPSSDATVPAQQLYEWLIRPLETVLAEADADTLIYAPDNTLRYIPLAALHDATTDQWLAERYTINTITALSLTDFNTAPQDTRVLAGAFADGNYTFQVGDRTFDFSGLPHAGIEVETLVATVPDTTSLLDANFSRATVEAQMSDYSILHLATHAAFVPGQPDESFIVFGDGARATFRDVELWNLTNTDLVVLSACETAVGANGEELLGFGYLMQQAGARAAIASLWQVSDGGTQALMDAFYAALQQPDITKAEALRQAQMALITGDFSGLGLDERGATGIRQRIDATVPERVSQQLDHPYYWAPFILIGNGL